MKCLFVMYALAFRTLGHVVLAWVAQSKCVYAHLYSGKLRWSACWEMQKPVTHGRDVNAFIYL